MLCENLKIFFACYVNLELLTSLNLKDLKSIYAKNNVRKLKTLYVGDKAEKLAKYLKKNKILKPIVLDFYRTVRKAYIQAGNYLQQKYRVENPLLESMAGLDPNSRQMSQTHEKLISLKSFFEPFSIDNSSDFTAELRNYVIDSDLPQPQEMERLDICWNKIFEAICYPILSSLVKASLNIFTDPMVERLFSMRKLTKKKNPKIKGAKKKSKVHEKVTVKLAFYFYNFIRQSYLSFS